MLNSLWSCCIYGTITINNIDIISLIRIVSISTIPRVNGVGCSTTIHQQIQLTNPKVNVAKTAIKLNNFLLGYNAIACIISQEIYKKREPAGSLSE